MPLPLFLFTATKFELKKFAELSYTFVHELKSASLRTPEPFFKEIQHVKISDPFPLRHHSSQGPEELLNFGRTLSK
jgi:hypothetical protein